MRKRPRWFFRAGNRQSDTVDADCYAHKQGCRLIPNEVVFGYILPGAAISIIAGNIFYSIQARQLAMRTGRGDVTALPYGINTVSLFAYIFL